MTHAPDPWDLAPAARAAAEAWLDGWRARPEGDPDGGAPGDWVGEPGTGGGLAFVRADGAAGVDHAVRAARAAHDAGTWRNLPRRHRADALRQIGAVVRAHAAELAAIQSIENGKLFVESLLDDLPDTADVFDYYAGWADKVQGTTNPQDGDLLNETVREPVGVCALVVPWNYPLLLAAWKLAPALVCGNPVVCKPSEHAPLAVLRMVELIRAAVDLPPGVLEVVVGGAETGEALVSHPDVAKVSFTGSTAVGRRILSSIASSNLATTTLELGGNAPNVVFADVPDLDAVIDRHAAVLFAQKGEKCTEPARLIVERSVHERAVERLVAHATSLRCGDPFDRTASQGAQCTEAQFRRIPGLIADAVDAGAVVRCGGGVAPLAAESGGWFLEATVLDEVTAGNPIDAVEVFGPVVKVSVFDTEDEAVALANGTPFGLAAGVNSGDLARARRVARRLDAGQVFVNRYGCYDFAAPFGGFGGSGWGKELGGDSLDAYTRVKSIWTDLGA